MLLEKKVMDAEIQLILGNNLGGQSPPALGLEWQTRFPGLVHTNSSRVLGCVSQLLLWTACLACIYDLPVHDLSGCFADGSLLCYMVGLILPLN